MRARILAVIVAVVLGTGCASFHRIEIPKWERYQQGDLAGFLRAPAERIVDSAGSVKESARMAAHTVRLARGTVEFQREHTIRTYGAGGSTTQTIPASPRPDAHVDLTMEGGPTFVFELRGPGSDRRMRTVATRARAFDFGPVPDGTYTFKATVLLNGGFWRALVGTITVSDSADAAPAIRVVL